ncbi:MAG: response regulator [Nitrospira sp.]|nr:response regulator [Nitrospira sp.]
MMPAVITAEPKKAIPLAACCLDSQMSHPSCAVLNAQELVDYTRDRREARTVHSALVIEDDPDISLALQDLLEFEGFRVDCASTCRQAFASITQNTYDVVLLDLGLPDGDGSSILEDLRVSRPALPVIVLTASNRDLGSLPAFARITKPWVRRDLCNILHRALGTTSTPVV